MKYLLLVLCFVIQSAFTQTHILSGLVLDATTLDPLPSATIRVIGTSKGTVTNSSGQFRIALPEGTIHVAASYLGYQSDTIIVELSTNQFQGIQLQPNAIQLAGITVTDEDPAYEIIRRAIESKQKWMTQLQTFEGKAFNRLQIRTDSSIAAITEAYSMLYWRHDDSLREVITQQKQTGNIPKSFSASRVGNVLNFNDDQIRLNGYRFVGPTAPNAFDYYEYKLLSTRKMDDFDVYSIELIPKSKIAPLFKGIISIAERSYSVMDVDVRPNEAMSQPFVDLRDARHRQTFILFENKFWLPNNYRFDGTIKINLMGLKFPAFTIERDVVIYNYSINPEFADTIRLLNQFTIDSSVTKYDSTFWTENDVLPLTAEQDTAYKILDSTQTLDKKFAPKGFAASFLEASGGTFGIADVWFNRVEGLHLGVSKSFDNVFENFDLRGGIGYGLSDKQWKYETGVTIHFGGKQTSSASSGFASISLKRQMFSLSLDLYDKHYSFPEPIFSGLFLNSLAALFLKDDVQDYFRAKGSTAVITYAYNGTTRFTFSALTEQQLSVYQTTNYSILKRNDPYVYQPSIINGRMNEVKISIHQGSSGLFGFAKDAYLLSATGVHSSAVIGSDFDFTKLMGKARMKFATMNKEELVFPPAIGFQIAGGTTIGALPPQRYFELYSRFETFAGYGTLKGLPRREYYGDSYLQFTIDHNFRRVLFAPFDIQWLMESNLELIVEANTARSWFSGNELRTPLFPSRDSHGWYTEASIGISNILDVFRFDVTRRFSSPGDWSYTLTASDFIMALIPQ
ncbi:MAG: DUF5686 family protein [Bacteroidota bacterium]|nr:DUF5686 family protein [Bacteroidota bacterium]